MRIRPRRSCELWPAGSDPAPPLGIRKGDRPGAGGRSVCAATQRRGPMPTRQPAVSRPAPGSHAARRRHGGDVAPSAGATWQPAGSGRSGRPGLHDLPRGTLHAHPPPPSAWDASTRQSSVGPMSSASFPMRRQCSAWSGVCLSRSGTIRRWAGVTSARSRWPDSSRPRRYS